MGPVEAEIGCPVDGFINGPNERGAGVGQGGERPMQLVDLNHVIRHGMVTYPELPGPEIGEHLSWETSRERYAAGTEIRIAQISMVANTRT
jgi:hypothetical protein